MSGLGVPQIGWSQPWRLRHPMRGFPITAMPICLVQCPNLPIIEKGALPNLLSLRVLNQDLDGLSGIQIEWHEFLQEIALDSEVKPQTQAEWKNAAKNHQKRPRILYLKRVSPNGMGSMVKYVATEKPILGLVPPSCWGNGRWLCSNRIYLTNPVLI